MAVRQRSERVARGQHFLRSSALATALVRDAGLDAGELVVDLGAGTGVLTRALARRGARVVAVELDPMLVSGLRERFSGTAAVRVVEADARGWELPDEPFAVVANLPFAGSREILRRLLDNPRLALRRADVIVEWDAAVKAAAVWPGTLAGATWGAWFELAVTRRLARTAFSPPPRVDAGVLRAVRRTHPLVPETDHHSYRRFVRDAYRARAPLRRALRSSLSPRELKRLGEGHGFSADGLPRDLDAAQWAATFSFVRSRGRI